MTIFTAQARLTMNVIQTSCPQCQRPLEIPLDFDTVICARCGASYEVREHKGAINLLERESNAASAMSTTPFGIIDSRLTELEELIQETSSEVELMKSREQSGPLQLGCALYGVFAMVIVVIAMFMLLAKSYVGSWWFYASVVLIVLLGLSRVRRKRLTAAQIDQFRNERLRLEKELSELESERARIRQLRNRINPLEEL
ncbi:MAG: hypothetical protein WAV20_22105 [Blastocatellia bacterium]